MGLVRGTLCRSSPKFLHGPVLTEVPRIDIVQDGVSGANIVGSTDIGGKKLQLTASPCSRAQSLTKITFKIYAR